MGSSTSRNGWPNPGDETDNPYLVPGGSLHDELEYLVQAGFTPYEAIEAGTRNAAEALGRLDEFGTVTEGVRADLILVKENPLQDVANVRKGVQSSMILYSLPLTCCL